MLLSRSEFFICLSFLVYCFWIHEVDYGNVGLVFIFAYTFRELLDTCPGKIATERLSKGLRKGYRDHGSLVMGTWLTCITGCG